MAASFQDSYPTAPHRDLQERRDATQLRLINGFLERYPHRIEMIEVVTGERSEDSGTDDRTKKFIARREGYLRAIAVGDPQAIALAARGFDLDSIPELYALHRSQSRSHKMTRGQASYFINWLHGDIKDWMLNYPRRLEVGLLSATLPTTITFD